MCATLEHIWLVKTKCHMILTFLSVAFIIVAGVCFGKAQSWYEHKVCDDDAKIINDYAYSRSTSKLTCDPTELSTLTLGAEPGCACSFHGWHCAPAGSAATHDSRKYLYLCAQDKDTKDAKLAPEDQICVAPVYKQSDPGGIYFDCTFSKYAAGFVKPTAIVCGVVSLLAGLIIFWVVARQIREAMAADAAGGNYQQVI